MRPIGIFYFMSQEGTEGDGMGVIGGGSGLFVGSFWAGTDVDYICNRDYAGVYPGVETLEWEVMTEPNGRVKDLTTATNEQVFSSTFSDSGHDSPKPLTVDLMSYAYSDGLDNKFVILEYNLTNGGASALNNLYTGIFCDFDLASSGANVGGSDETLNVTYINGGAAGVGPYFGIALLGDPNTSTNLTLMDNETYVYGTSSIEDGMKMRHLRGNISLPSSETPADWSAVTSKQVNLAASGGTAKVVYALVYGEDLADMLAQVEAANDAYNPTTPADEDTPAKLVRLGQNHPNPFNPSTNIKFGVAQDGHVELGVYDLSGRRVRTLISSFRTAGDHQISWDGKDDNGSQAPSGMYFYKLNTGGKTISRKMTLVK